MNININIFIFVRLSRLIVFAQFQTTKKVFKNAWRKLKDLTTKAKSK